KLLGERGAALPNAEIKAAIVGTLLKAHGLDWAPQGYSKLRDLLNDLETRGQVRVGFDQKRALTVYVGSQPKPVAALQLAPTAAPSSAPKLIAPRFRPLKRTVWDAWVNDRLTVERRIDPASGTVWWLTNPTPPRSAERWLDVRPISTVTQIG